MSQDTNLTIVGNLTGDPELRFTPSGAPVANFTIASTPRRFDKASNEWKDGESLFMRCSAWKDMAENVAESLTRGTAVIAQGRLKSRSYDTKDGEKRTVIELEVDSIGPDLRRATAKVTKAARSGGGFGQAASQGAAAAVDPWATARPAQGGGWGNAAPALDTEPPFAFPPNSPVN